MSPERKLRHAGAVACRRKFLRLFPGGYRDDEFVELEREYKWQAHWRWRAELAPRSMRQLLGERRHAEIAARAVAIEARTNLLFSFEKMALRDAVKSPAGAEAFATGLWHWLHGHGSLERRFARWVEVVGALPRRQTRVLTWPLVTVFGFLAQPETHMFLKPNVTRTAARAYGFDLVYRPRPCWETYASLLDLAETVRRDTRDLGPRDMIDLQSFLWIMGSDEYEE